MPIRWTPSATRDLTRICDYIQEHDGAAIAHTLAIRLFDGVESLGELSSRARPGRLEKTREFMFANLPYIAVYRIQEKDVHIIRILHTAQNWP